MMLFEIYCIAMTIIIAGIPTGIMIWLTPINGDIL